MKPRDVLRALWAQPIIRHLVSFGAAVLVSVNLTKAGVDPATAKQAGAAVREVIQTMPTP